MLGYLTCYCKLGALYLLYKREVYLFNFIDLHRGELSAFCRLSPGRSYETLNL